MPEPRNQTVFYIEDNTNDATREIPIIAVSADIAKFDIQRAMATGFSLRHKADRR